MRSTFIDMNGIVKEFVESTTKGITDRKINWDIIELPEVFADAPLIRQVWVNLISNAVKFSKNVEEANIKISFSENYSDYIFSIKDNGAGFDIQYAQNLFGVFQRLHSKEEFEGTGIGLANVQRIIQRHGEKFGQLLNRERGTILFTLPKKQRN
ncbi:MAG: GHKL domain-containing protein [Ignavibacteriales bacterium]|nr:GHKL domain-containing protein [Ignavibacteriales bacterium]